ncbi:uracil-DNA glycosylase [Pusillimonas sp. SM2304]|uniref:uracil-DNA glycosylase n=1 Tax=Pusillimonas sp. SM2304 TaxID=3073241 RepID=UPI0028766AFE|nr:uracil-DNA glycosylase [Pusillimonas sp. SM2304]MDS1140909.1 uracil-DNA glycosylase [Pusillimonas sp. SM2304]
MINDTGQKAPQLSTLQKAWLQEIGLDRRMLAYYASQPAADPAEPADGATDVQAKTCPAPAARAGHAQRPAGLQRVSKVLAQASPPAAPAPALAPQAPSGQAVPQDWESLEAHIAQCQSCGLHAGRSHAVFGAGVAQAPDWMIIGEAPGSYDDRAGLPFQGKAGVLLQAMLAAIQVTDESPVFMTNLIKCRPLGNRTPKPDEIAACLPYLRRQIALLAPRRILALGALAAQAVLDSTADLEALRGTVHAIASEAGQSIPVVVTYHPAALLLRPQHKPDAWQDLNLARSLALDAVNP